MLTVGQTVADHKELSKFQSKINDKSKTIKKGARSDAKGTSHEITKEKVRAKLAKSRVAVSTYRINK